tara:strand:+ start:1196 stop:1450 length:255 start_codon:yes stop_codon:yes gene_type:complete
MNDKKIRIASQLFKNAITLLKEDCFTEPDNTSDDLGIAKLIAGEVNYEKEKVYDIIELLLNEINDKEVRDSFNRIHEVFITRWY